MARNQRLESLSPIRGMRRYRLESPGSKWLIYIIPFPLRSCSDMVFSNSQPKKNDDHDFFRKFEAFILMIMITLFFFSAFDIFSRLPLRVHMFTRWIFVSPCTSKDCEKSLSESSKWSIITSWSVLLLNATNQKRREDPKNVENVPSLRMAKRNRN